MPLVGGVFWSHLRGVLIYCSFDTIVPLHAAVLHFDTVRSCAPHVPEPKFLDLLLATCAPTPGQYFGHIGGVRVIRSWRPPPSRMPRMVVARCRYIVCRLEHPVERPYDSTVVGPLPAPRSCQQQNNVSL